MIFSNCIGWERAFCFPAWIDVLYPFGFFGAGLRSGRDGGEGGSGAHVRRGMDTWVVAGRRDSWIRHRGRREGRNELRTPHMHMLFSSDTITT